MPRLHDTLPRPASIWACCASAPHAIGVFEPDTPRETEIVLCAPCAGIWRHTPGAVTRPLRA